jgi:hypothetical protein
MSVSTFSFPLNGRVGTSFEFQDFVDLSVGLTVRPDRRSLGLRFSWRIAVSERFLLTAIDEKKVNAIRHKHVM